MPEAAVNPTSDLVSRILTARTDCACGSLVVELLAALPSNLASRITAPLVQVAPSIPDLAGLAAHISEPQRRRRAQDFVVGHLAMADLGLSPLSPDQIDEALASIALTDALCLLARMADDSDQALGSAEKQVGLAFTYLPPQYALRAVRKVQESGARVFSAQLPLLLARRALNACPDEGSSMWHDNSCLLLTCWLLGMLAIAIGEMVPVAHTDEDLALTSPEPSISSASCTTSSMKTPTTCSSWRFRRRHSC